MHAAWACMACMQASAVRDALKCLFSEKRLPDNPYYYLANVLAAYVDQSQLWKVRAPGSSSSTWG